MKKNYHFDLKIHILNYQLMFIKNRVWPLSRKTIFGQIIKFQYCIHMQTMPEAEPPNTDQGTKQECSNQVYCLIIN